MMHYQSLGVHSKQIWLQSTTMSREFEMELKRRKKKNFILICIETVNLHPKDVESSPYPLKR
jgi:hypothetical protein